MTKEYKIVNFCVMHPGEGGEFYIEELEFDLADLDKMLEGSNRLVLAGVTHLEGEAFMSDNGLVDGTVLIDGWGLEAELESMWEYTQEDGTDQEFKAEFDKCADRIREEVGHTGNFISWSVEYDTECAVMVRGDADVLRTEVKKRLRAMYEDDGGEGEVVWS